VKELISDFKLIYRNDRKVLVAMIFLLLAGVILFLLPLLNLNPAIPRTWVRYSDINNGYAEGSWWYLLSFSVLAVIMSIGHCLIGARAYSKRGAGVAMLFLMVSIAMVLMAIAFLLKILGRG
jgi:hypothetical protein